VGVWGASRRKALFEEFPKSTPRGVVNGRVAGLFILD
jgi:hypothetical protein